MTNKEPKHKFILLCPVLNEEKNIVNLINGLFSMRYPKDLFEIYVITTEKEKIKNEKHDTIFILNKHLQENSFKNINVIHYPHKHGFKAEQLNFAYNYILKKEKNLDDFFFCLVDADTLISPEMLDILNKSIEKDILVYQQPITWFKNFNSISNCSIVKSFPLMQTYHTVAYEIPMVEEKYNPLRLKYFIGPGITIKGNLLSKFGGFPDIIEDTRFGRLCSFLNIKSKTVPMWGIVESAKSYKILIKQLSVWSLGTNLFFADYQYAKKIDPNISKLKAHFMIFYAVFKSMRWQNEGLLHFILLVYSLYIHNSLLLLIVASSLVLRTILPCIFISMKMKKDLRDRLDLKAGELLISIIFSPFVYLFDFIGPYTGMIKALKLKILKKVDLYKTER